jgi:hypothetical protein
MGVETPIAPGAMNAAAPDGAPPRRIRKIGIKFLLLLFRSLVPAPPWLEEPDGSSRV